jgi:hypothetical protein
MGAMDLASLNVANAIGAWAGGLAIAGGYGLFIRRVGRVWADAIWAAGLHADHTEGVSAGTCVKPAAAPAIAF